MRTRSHAHARANAQAIGMFFEVVSDYQKDTFLSDPANKTRLLKDGLWGISRHPNYFGDIMIWIGIYIASMPVFDAAGSTKVAYVSVVSPLFTVRQ